MSNGKFDIAHGDTLTDPAHWDDEPFEAIVSNPPYSIRWAGDGNPLLINDPRFAPAGVLAPKSKTDLAFMMHILSWLSQQQVADLFQTSRTNVVEHIANTYAAGELRQEATCREFRQVRTEGSRQVTRTLPFYDLDLIISLGYRVRSHVATAFRIWATKRLRE